MPRLPGPILSTPRLTLRTPKVRDVPALYRGTCDAQVHRYLAMGRPPGPKFTLEFVRRAAREQRAGAELHYVLHDRATDAAIGCCGALHVDTDVHRKAEIGFWLARPYWGRGLMPEALAAFLPHLFVEVGLHRLYAQVFLHNGRSMRVLERLGFQAEGILRQHVRKNDRAYDVRQYSLLNGDPGARRLLRDAARPRG